LRLELATEGGHAGVPRAFGQRRCAVADAFETDGIGGGLSARTAEVGRALRKYGDEWSVAGAQVAVARPARALEREIRIVEGLLLRRGVDVAERVLGGNGFGVVSDAALASGAISMSASATNGRPRHTVAARRGRSNVMGMVVT
jgi:hypothetical protein